MASVGLSSRPAPPMESCGFIESQLVLVRRIVTKHRPAHRDPKDPAPHVNPDAPRAVLAVVRIGPGTDTRAWPVAPHPCRLVVQELRCIELPCGKAEFKADRDLPAARIVFTLTVPG